MLSSPATLALWVFVSGLYEAAELEGSFQHNYYSTTNVHGLDEEGFENRLQGLGLYGVVSVPGSSY